MNKMSTDPTTQERSLPSESGGRNTRCVPGLTNMLHAERVKTDTRQRYSARLAQGGAGSDNSPRCSAGRPLAKHSNTPILIRKDAGRLPNNTRPMQTSQTASSSETADPVIPVSCANDSTHASNSCAGAESIPFLADTREVSNNNNNSSSKIPFILARHSFVDEDTLAALTQAYHRQTKQMRKAAQLTSSMLARAARIADISEEQKQRAIRAVVDGANIDTMQSSSAMTSEDVNGADDAAQASLTSESGMSRTQVRAKGAAGKTTFSTHPAELDEHEESARREDLDEHEESARREDLDGFVQKNFSLKENLEMQVSEKSKRLAKLRELQVTIAELDDSNEHANYRDECSGGHVSDAYVTREASATSTMRDKDNSVVARTHNETSVATTALVSCTKSDHVATSATPSSSTAHAAKLPPPFLRTRRRSRQCMMNELKATLCTSLEQMSDMSALPSPPTAFTSNSLAVTLEYIGRSALLVVDATDVICLGAAFKASDEPVNISHALSRLQEQETYLIQCYTAALSHLKHFTYSTQALIDSGEFEVNSLREEFLRGKDMLASQEQKLAQAEEQRNSLRLHLHTLSCRCDMWENMLLRRCSSSLLRQLPTERLDSVVLGERGSHLTQRGSAFLPIRPLSSSQTSCIMSQSCTNYALTPVQHMNSCSHMSLSGTAPHSLAECGSMAPSQSARSSVAYKAIQGEGAKLFDAVRVECREAGGDGSKQERHDSPAHDSDTSMQRGSYHHGEGFASAATSTSATNAVATQSSVCVRYDTDEATSSCPHSSLPKQAALSADELLELRVAETWGNPYAKRVTMFRRQCGDGSNSGQDRFLFARPLLTLTPSNHRSVSSSPRHTDREQTNVAMHRMELRTPKGRRSRSESNGPHACTGEGRCERQRESRELERHALPDLAPVQLTATRWPLCAEQTRGESEKMSIATVQSVLNTCTTSPVLNSLPAQSGYIDATAKSRALFLLQSLLQAMHAEGVPTKSNLVPLAESHEGVASEVCPTKTPSSLRRDHSDGDRVAARQSIENIIRYLQSRTPANAKV